MRKKVLYLIIAFIVFQLQIVLWQLVFRPIHYRDVIVLNDGWTVNYNGATYTDVKLSNLRNLLGTSTYAGDTITMSKKIEPLADHLSPTLMFETNFSAWKLHFGGAELATHHYDKLQKGQFVGSERNFVPMPSSTGEVNLELELYVTDDGAYSYYSAPLLGSYSDVLLYCVYTNMFVFMASTFLITFGLMFFAITLGFRSSMPEIRMQTFASLLFITLGVWFLAQFKLFSLFVNTRDHETELEYISLYLVVPLMYMVMGSLQDYLKKKIFIAFASISTLVALLPILLHTFGLVHINKFLVVYQIDALVLVIFMLVMLINDYRSTGLNTSQAIQFAGQCVLAGSFIINVLFYYLEVYGISEQLMISKIVVPMGALCMVFASLVNYYVYISETYARKKERASLAHLAYADGLTGIPNRSRYEKYLSDLDETDEDYCIVSIDLNNLKTVNDHSGHLMGDRYLSEFTKALEKNSLNKGFIARIGGDEFVLVLTGENMELADNIMGHVQRELDRINNLSKLYKRSAAYGYAFRHEITAGDFNQVYLLADQRMYRHKSEMKEKMA